MKLIQRAFCLILTATLSASLAACAAQPSKKATPEVTDAVPPPAILRAITVGANNAPDYPGAQKLTAEELVQKADEVVSFAAQCSMNAIVYKATPFGEAAYPSKILPLSQTFDFSAGLFGKLDPLEILIERAKAQNIAVYAQISPYEAGRAKDEPSRNSIAKQYPETVISISGNRFYRPDSPYLQTRAVSAAAELAENYALTGILLGDVDDSPVSDYGGFYTYLTALAADLCETVNSVNKQMQFGIALTDKVNADINRAAFIDEICRTGADFLTMKLSAPTAGTISSLYTKALTPLLAAAQSHQTGFYTAIPADIPEQSCRDVFFINNENGLSGGVLDGYAGLNAAGDLLDAAIPLLFIERPIVPDFTLDIPTEFRITQPLDGKKINLGTDVEHYYIAGTSDPKSPVMSDGAEIEHFESGLFGKFVDLDYGLNEFSFVQDGKILIASIVRAMPNEPAAKISAISNYAASPATSVFQPYGPQAVTGDMPMIFQCMAPSGGTVTALLNGETYQLEQTVKAEDGIPVKFRKEVRIPAPNPDEITSAGFVTYQLDFKERTSAVEAPGEVFLVGKNRKPIFRIKDYVHFVLRRNENGQVVNDGVYAAILKYGSIGEIIGQTENFFITSYGGYVTKAGTTIVTDIQEPENNISSATYTQTMESGEESLVLSGSLSPSFIVDEAQNGNFSIRLMDTRGLPDGDILIDSNFFSSLKSTARDGMTTLTFTAGSEPFSGYNVAYDGTDTILSFKGKPRLSNVRGRPLAGLTVVLDPGHGGKDIGAPGVPNITGPVEKTANLYAALMMRPLLEGLGATVYMTRETDDEFPSLDERVAFTEDHNADLFFSVHHNSLDPWNNPAKARGTEVYWWNDISEDLAAASLEHISQASGRTARKAESSYYVFLRNHIAPSVLLELGFMPNPKEYEEICSQDNMLSIANAVCDSIVDYLNSSS